MSKILVKKETLFKRSNLFAVLLIILGSAVWVFTMFKSGLKYPFGIGFWGANGHDAFWHLALSERLSNLSFESPVFAGEKIKNYHLGFGVFLALVHKLTQISSSVLYFQIFPIIFALLIGFLVYKFILEWRESKKEALWSLFFVYFGSSFGFIISVLRGGEITGDSMFWSQQSLSTLINPPFAMSLVVILAGLIFLLKYLKKTQIKYLIFASLAFGLLIQIKAYSGILALLGLGIATIWQLLVKKKTSLLKVTMLSAVISVLVFLPFLEKSVGLLVFQPFWFLETMMTYSDRLGWDKFYSAMTTYKMGKIWGKAILAYGVAFIIFVIGNLGTRIIGLFSFVQILNKKIKVNEVGVYILTVLFFSLAIPTFFVQTGTPWNTIQFFYYFQFFFALYAGISTATLIKKLKPIPKVLLTVFLIIFGIFGSWSSLRHYWSSTPPAKLSNGEVEALKFLASQPDGVVFTYPFDKYQAKAAEAIAPRPLYLYDSTAYVSAFSKKTVFLEDEVNLNITGYQWRERKENILDFYNTLDVKKGYNFLRLNNITYVYWLKSQHARVGDTELGLNKIFENNEVWIFKLKEK